MTPVMKLILKSEGCHKNNCIMYEAYLKGKGRAVIKKYKKWVLLAYLVPIKLLHMFVISIFLSAALPFIILLPRG